VTFWELARKKGSQEQIESLKKDWMNFGKAKTTLEEWGKCVTHRGGARAKGDAGLMIKIFGSRYKKGRCFHEILWRENVEIQ